MKKILKNNDKAKKYLESLPKLYVVFKWAKYGILEVSWSGKYNLAGVPLVYVYYDCNGSCDEYHLLPITFASAGKYFNWYHRREFAEATTEFLNKEEL